jgi:hypothetical protein
MTSPRVPRIGEKNLVDGHGKSVYVIGSVDETGGVAVLKLESNAAIHLQGIPFSAIHLIKEDVNQAAARIVTEATNRL